MPPSHRTPPKPGVGHRFGRPIDDPRDIFQINRDAVDDIDWQVSQLVRVLNKIARVHHDLLLPMMKLTGWQQLIGDIDCPGDLERRGNLTRHLSGFSYFASGVAPFYGVARACTQETRSFRTMSR